MGMAPSVELPVTNVTCLKIGQVVSALMASQVLLPCEGPAAAIGLAMELSIFHFVELHLWQSLGESHYVRAPTLGFWWASGRPVWLSLSWTLLSLSVSVSERMVDCIRAGPLLPHKASVFCAPATRSSSAGWDGSAFVAGCGSVAGIPQLLWF
jgi:hypothetical protein